MVLLISLVGESVEIFPRTISRSPFLRDSLDCRERHAHECHRRITRCHDLCPGLLTAAKLRASRPLPRDSCQCGAADRDDLWLPHRANDQLPGDPEAIRPVTDRIETNEPRNHFDDDDDDDDDGHDEHDDHRQLKHHRG